MATKSWKGRSPFAQGSGGSPAPGHFGFLPVILADFRLLVPRAVRGRSHQICDNLFGQPWEMNAKGLEHCFQCWTHHSSVFHQPLWAGVRACKRVPCFWGLKATKMYFSCGFEGQKIKIRASAAECFWGSGAFILAYGDCRHPSASLVYRSHANLCCLQVAFF